MASSHWWRDASWPSIPARIRRIVAYTLWQVVCTTKLGAGSSRRSATRDGSCRWMSPRVAVLTGVEAPCAPPPARGGGMKKTSWCCVWIPAAGGRTMFWFLSTLCEGRILCNSLCASWVLSDNISPRVNCCISFVVSGLGGHTAREACACVASASSSSAWRVLLLVPTPGVGFWGGATCRSPYFFLAYWLMAAPPSPSGDLERVRAQAKWVVWLFPLLVNSV